MRDRSTSNIRSPFDLIFVHLFRSYCVTLLTAPPLCVATSPTSAPIFTLSGRTSPYNSDRRTPYFSSRGPLS